MAVSLEVRDPLPGLLREWAQWYESLNAVGYADSTAVWRAAQGEGGGGFASSIPPGVDRLRLHGALRRLVEAMDALMADEDARLSVAIVQAFYLCGPVKVRDKLGWGTSKIYTVVTTGEALIRREMKLR